jgi:DNA-binding CsgD family transcriptional regulator
VSADGAGGAAVSQDAAVRRLHRAIATRLLDTLDTDAPSAVRPTVLAGHVAAAGRALPPRPDLVDRLREDERLVPLSDPARHSARHAAHRYAAWWHAEEGEQRSRIAADLVRLLVRTADYAGLARFAEELATDDRRPELDPAGRAELAAAAALAALHLGRPVAEPVRAAVTGVPAALEFCDRWFAGTATRLGDIESAFAPLRPSPALPTIEWRTRHRREVAANVEHAFAMRDLVPVFESVLGSNYRTVVNGTVIDGPLAAYHRVLAGYAGEDWAAALSAARELELDPHADVLARQCARLHAAEMCGWRGEDRRAAAWLDSVGEHDFPVLRGWVEVGLRYHAGDVAGALRAGWRACERAAGEDAPTGLSRLLRRMAAIAVESGEPLQARRAYTEAERWYSRCDTPDALETVLYVRGLVNADGAQARAAERLIRRRGNRFELSMACQLVGATAAEPRPWLHEAFQIAQAIGATRLTARTRRSMAGRGVAVSAPRGGREQLSETERRIIELIRIGQTNRQIALAVRMSEKTVEKHLTRLFAKAGCRTRHGLATSALGGQPESLGA